MTDTRILPWTQDLFAIYGDDNDEGGGLPPSRDIYYAWREDEPNPWLAHYCLNLPPDGVPHPEWGWAGTGLHTLVSREPLHLEPSIGWMHCCGRHGFIRGGVWEPAGDGGWQP